MYYEVHTPQTLFQDGSTVAGKILEIKPRFPDCKVKLCLDPRTQESSSQKVSSSLNYCDPIQFED